MNDVRGGARAWSQGARRLGLLTAAMFFLPPLLLTVHAGPPDPLPGTTGVVNADFTPAGSLAATRWAAPSVQLADGRVLAAGGVWLPGYARRDAAVFDPKTASWTATGNLRLQRYGHGLARLNDGRVLVIGGVPSNECASATYASVTEIWDPATGLFTTEGIGTMVNPRVGAAVVTLNDGRVLAAGGWNRCGTTYVASEIFDPKTLTWSATGDLNAPRQGAAAVLLPDGRVLIAGGTGPDPFRVALDTAEIYDPSKGMWTLTGSMFKKRFWSSESDADQGHLVLLPDGHVLTAGGTYR